METLDLEKIKTTEKVNTGDPDVAAAVEAELLKREASDSQSEEAPKETVVEGIKFDADPEFSARRDEAVKAIADIKSGKYFEDLHKKWEAEAVQSRENAIAALAPDTNTKMEETVESMELVNEVGQDVEKMVADVKEYTDWLKAKIAEAEKGNSRVAEGLLGIELEKEKENLNKQLDTLVESLKAKEENAGALLSAKIGMAIRDIDALRM